MSWLTNKLIAFMIKNNVISDDKDVVAFYTYGIEITISSALNIVLVLIIGILLSDIINAIVFLCTFVFVRKFTGGYHAETYFRCNLIMCVGFIIVNYLSRIGINHISIYNAVIIESVVIVIIAVLAPVENPNKPIGHNRKPIYKIISVLIVGVLSTLSVVLIGRHYIIGSVLMFTMLLISVLMAAAKIKERSEKKCQQ